MAQRARHWLFPYGAPMAHDGAKPPVLTGALTTTKKKGTSDHDQQRNHDR